VNEVDVKVGIIVLLELFYNKLVLTHLRLGLFILCL
jgi:hypothetical protein